MTDAHRPSATPRRVSRPAQGALVAPGTMALFALGMAAVLLGIRPGSATVAAQPTGKVQCSITENDETATGTLTLRTDGGRIVASGACGEALTVPPGRYVAVVGLDGALDSPEQRHTVQVTANEVARVAVNFTTAVLEIRIEANGRRAAGMAVIRRDGRQIGTLGSGVAAHLSVGSYEVVARYRTQERRFEALKLQAGERRQLVASF